MKKIFPIINKGFFVKHLNEILIYKENAFYSPSLTFEKYLTAYCKAPDFPEEINNMKSFCKQYNLPENTVNDFALMHMLFYDSANDRHFYEPEFLNEANEIKTWFKLGTLLKNHSISKRKNTKNEHSLQSMTFNFQNLDPIIVSTNSIPGETFKELTAFFSSFEYQANLNIPKNRITADLRTFSWALLNYLNDYTQYKTPKGKLVTREQCRFIYDFLDMASCLQHRPEEDMDKAEYIRRQIEESIKGSRSVKK
ncbi:MAG: hypothetical protein IPP86_02985 [Bacteroidetes bacterium]|nr:hypothetical protein [Bacteroidota bacterium]